MLWLILNRFPNFSLLLKQLTYLITFPSTKLIQILDLLFSKQNFWMAKMKNTFQLSYFKTSLFIVMIFLCASTYAQWNKQQKIITNNLHKFLPHFLEYALHITETDYPSWLFPDILKKPTSFADTILTEIGNWPYGLCYAVDAKGNYAYVGNGSTFQVLDISNPSLPAIVGEYFTSAAYMRDIRVRDSLAFVITGGLLILNISNPYSPQQVGYLQFPVAPVRLALADSFAFVSFYTGVIRVVDISDPTSPTLRGGAAVDEWPYCLAAKGLYAYAAGMVFLPGLTIIDATNPDSLTTSYLDIGKKPYSAFVLDTLLFVGTSGYSPEYNNTLKVYNIVNPLSPVYLGETEIIGNNYETIIQSITAVGNYVYLATSAPAVYSVNIYNPYFPMVTSYFDAQIPSGYNWWGKSISISETTVFAAYPGKLWLINATDPNSLSELTSYPTGGTAENVAMKDSILFVAAGPAGLWMLDVSDPNQPETIANLDSIGFTVDVIVADNLVYIASMGVLPDDPLRGVWIINISNPLQPTIVGHHIGIETNFSWGVSIYKFENLIFRSENGYPSMLEIIDVLDPANPVQLTIFQRPYFTRDIAVKDSFAYWLTTDSGVIIIDCRNLFSPVEVSSVLSGTTDYLISIVIRDSLAYVNHSTALFALDISSPYSVQITDTLNGVYDASDLVVFSNYLYGSSGFVVDISNSSELIEVGRASIFEGAGVGAMNNLVFFAENVWGMSIYKNQLITSVKWDQGKHLTQTLELYQNYPNPFNPSTTIRFDIPVPGIVSLRLYNILGQEVATLMNEAKQEGSYEVVLDATQLTSGVYFYQLKTRNFTQTKKLILLR